MHKTIFTLAAAGAAVMLTATAALAGPLTVGAIVQVSPAGSPFPGADADGPPCNGVPGSAQTGRNFPGAEVEPWVAVNPANPANLIGGWQQDRWSDGGSNALLYGYTLDGGASWQLSDVQPAFSRCTGGTAANNGDYERATDPWVTIAPNGHAYAMSLSLDIAQDANHAMLVSKSTDGGKTWGPVTVLKRDTEANVLNDKNSMTADPTDARYVYAIWDRLEFPQEQASPRAGERAVGYRGPTWFARTTNGGATWEPARMIFDPGQIDQTIGNQIVVTGDGNLVNGFNLIYNVKNAHKVRGMNVAVQRSTDKGATWSGVTIVDKLQSTGVSDPTTGFPVRTGDILPSIAASGQNVYMVWQDARTTGGARDQIAFARSTDGGRTWTTLSYAINTVHTTQAFTPAISVLPDGRIGVLHYDFRNDNGGTPLLTSTWLLHSHDGGATWTETKVGADFDMSTAAVAGGYFTGDYMGLGAAPSGFHPFWGVADGTTAVPASSILATTAD
ncbi:sialidase family protein [Nonomuraea sp. M3C6]|uniref:exo-alpha-sialidase n=1 Tax=Nonomuraea marmarensis TaxID=3351344 RepID=A0ABW7AU17_9ACTN